MPVKTERVAQVRILGCFLLSNPPPPPVPTNKLSQRRHTLKNKDKSDKPADGSIPGSNGGSALSASSCALAAQSSFAPFSAALDGVPFSLHPRFDMRVNMTVGHPHADRFPPLCFPHRDSSVSLSGAESSIKRHSH